jgi:hypothetical protein
MKTKTETDSETFAEYFYRNNGPAISAALTVLVLLSVCCCMPIGSGGSTNSRDMHSCAEACGSTGMQRWSFSGGCVCRPEPEICVDVD